MRPEQKTSLSARTRSLLTLIIPTRNEASNVPRLIEELREALFGVADRVVFVDDSADDTPEVVQSMSKEDERIVLIPREGAEQEGGLSTAGTAGLDRSEERRVGKEWR